MDATNSWLTGLGFGFLSDLNKYRTVGYLDNFYLSTILQSGLVGLFLQMGTIFYFIYLYFQRRRHITKRYRLCGGILVSMLYYGMFENSMFGNSPFDMINWLLIINVVNEEHIQGIKT